MRHYIARHHRQNPNTDRPIAGQGLFDRSAELRRNRGYRRHEPVVVLVRRSEKMDAVMERLRKEAASLGANGILLQSTGTESGGGVSTGIGTGFGIGGGLSIGTGIFTASDNKTGRGLAIYVPTQSPQYVEHSPGCVGRDHRCA
jgi:hypothetical protein